MDALPPEQRPRFWSDSFEIEGTQVPRVFVSAKTGEGLPELRRQLGAEVLREDPDEPRESAQMDETPV